MKVAVVSGANRGLGAQTARELAKQGYEVVLLGRNLKGLEAVAAEIRDNGGRAHVFELDVRDGAAVTQLAGMIRKKFGRLDVLVNNAAIFSENKGEDRSHAGGLTSPPETVLENFEVNALGPLRLCQALVPLMKEQGFGCVVNVSSVLGQLTEMNGGWPGYRMSKASLNVLTRLLADELRGAGVKVNSVCPGWVKTEMGGPNAERTPEEGASGIVWAATLGADGPSGGFFRDGKPIPW